MGVNLVYYKEASLVFRPREHHFRGDQCHQNVFMPYAPNLDASLKVVGTVTPDLHSILYVRVDYLEEERCPLTANDSAIMRDMFVASH